MKIKVGVFWLCNFDIVYDIEEIEIDENKKELFTYNKKHKEVWRDLSSKQFGAKYANYAYDFFQRGRVYYNSAIKEYLIVMNDNRKDIPKSFLEKINNLFGIQQ